MLLSLLSFAAWFRGSHGLSFVIRLGYRNKSDVTSAILTVSQ
jgi:hypothetical protein